MKKQNSSQPNNLAVLRHSIGLELKQVAKMLGQKSISQLSAYEHGRSPNLNTAIKLMLIYDTTPKEMFPDLVDTCRAAIEETIRQRIFVFAYPHRMKVLENINSCSFEDKLKPDISQDDKELVDRHLRSISRKLFQL